MPSLIPLLLLAAPQGQVTDVVVTDAVIRPEVKPFGVNLGRHADFSSNLLLRNIVGNPGFEPGTYRSVMHAAAGSTGDRWVQAFWNIAWNNDSFGIGQQEDFWNGATWEIVTGPSAGRTGTVLDYTHEFDEGILYLDSAGADPGVNDIIFLTRTIDEFPELSDIAVLETADLPPGTDGVHAVRLSYDPVETWRFGLNYYMDSDWRDGDVSAGKLQLIDGDWTFSCWAKAVNPGDSLRIRFQRTNEATFIDETIPLTTTWQQITRTYSFPEGTDDPRTYTELEPHPILAFQVHVGGLGEEVLIDDLVFERDGVRGSVFIDEVFDALEELQPGVLRFWAFQFGDSLEGLLAEPTASGYSGFSPGSRMPTYWTYGLHDFLDLCAKVGTDPWFVVPTTWSQAELEGLVEYMAGPADGAHPWADLRAARGQQDPWSTVFGTIHLEFGNEGWGGAGDGDPMFGASLKGGINLGNVADQRLGMLRAAPDYDDQVFDLIIGGQATFPGRQDEIEANATTHDTVAIAPYYARLIDDVVDADSTFAPIYADAWANSVFGGDVKDTQVIVDSYGRGTGLAIYELNFHTTKYDANNPIDIDVRNDIVTSHAGAMALPVHMLTWLREMGIETQIVHSLLGFSGGTNDGEDIRLFGIVRELLTSGNRRPNFHALRLTNLAMRGDMVATAQGGFDPGRIVMPANGLANAADLDYIQSFAFADGPVRTLILFNLDLNMAQDVRITTSAPVRRSGARVGSLAPADPYADNETVGAIEVEPSFFALPNFQSGTVLTLPAGSMTVMAWRQ
jgi:hypothetical protein